MKHELKIEPQYLKAKLEGDKLFEIRLNDRGYQKGDEVTYVEYSFSRDSPTKYHKFRITYVCNYNQVGNYVVFGERYIGTFDNMGEPIKMSEDT